METDNGKNEKKKQKKNDETTNSVTDKIHF